MNDYLDDIMLEYDIFLAEQELYDNLISLGASAYHESTGLLLIKEDYDGKVNNYIDKVVNGIQKAWNTFKKKVINADYKDYLASIKDKYTKWSSEHHEIILENFHTYNWSTFDSINVVDYDQDKLNNAENKTEYYKSVYGSFYTDDSKSLKENIIDKVMDTQPQHQITSQDVTGAFTFVAQEFRAKVSKLENDLKKFNASVEVIKNAINVTTNNGDDNAEIQQTTTVNNTQEATDMLIGLYESYNLLLEDDKNNDKKTKVVSNNDNDNDGSKRGENNNLKKLNMYITGNVDIMSAKMKILRNALWDSLTQILKQALPPKKDKDGKETVQQSVEVTSKQQVKI